MLLARTLLLGLAFAVSACTESPGGSLDADYGAAVSAKYVRKAQTSCAAINESDLYNCSGVDRSLGEARRDALTALDSYYTFQNYCSKDRGKATCDAMFESALAAISTQQPSHP